MSKIRNTTAAKVLAIFLMLAVFCSMSSYAFAANAASTGTAVAATKTTAAKKSKLILLGDSRTAGLRESQTGKLIYDLITTDDNVVWDFKWGAKFVDMTTYLVPRLELSGAVDSSSKIVLWMGYNDVVGNATATTQDYINYYNFMATLWGTRGAKVYVMNVGPAGKKSGQTKAEAEDYKNMNKKIRAFNKALKKDLLPTITVLDLYSYLGDNYATTDGTHYTKSTSKRIYSFAKKNAK